MDGEFRFLFFGASGDGLLSSEGTGRVDLEGVLDRTGRFNVGSTVLNDIGGKSDGGGRDHGDKEGGSCAGDFGELHDDRCIFA